MKNLNLETIKKRAKKIKILAPVGSFDVLHAAIEAGADEIYFGIAEFNMRSASSINFQIKDLKKIVKLCKKNNVRTCVTVNTLLFDNEISKVKDILNAIKSAQINAVIAADMATINYARKLNIETHISTQLSISNTESLKFFSQFADRVVLARELNLKQIKTISENIKTQNICGPNNNLIELEIFAHGALCVAISGRCGMSLFAGRKSANRGKCAHICRKQYKAIDIENNLEIKVDNNYLFSSKDLCTIGMLPEILNTNIDILKFEGRARKAEYVSLVIKTYKKALKSIEKGTYSPEKVKKWNKDLKTVYNRGFSMGMYQGIDFVDWANAHGNVSSKVRKKIGIIKRYYPNIKIAEVIIKAKDKIYLNEEYSIKSKKTGLVKGQLKEMRKNNKNIKSAKQKDIITFQVPKKVRKGDDFFVIRDRNHIAPISF